jgi:deoxyribodipyrimidine photo-lyase
MASGSSSKKFKNGLFIFRRDLRLIDNTSLNLLSSMCENLYTIFIFTPEQVGKSNSFKSNNAVQFMVESLYDLSREIEKEGGKLQCFYGKNERILQSLISTLEIDAVGFNLDITPYSTERDINILKMCAVLNVHTFCVQDYYLTKVEDVKTGANEPYQKFTPYYTAALKIPVKAPMRKRELPLKMLPHSVSLLHKITLEQAKKMFVRENEKILVRGGRENALQQVRKALKNVSHYSKTRNELSIPTSQLSAYIKFGNLSIREVYKLFKGNREFIRQLYWRDFYAQVLYHFPHTLTKSMKPKYDKIHWKNNVNWFKKWCDGNTGVPIVDACMRELNETGYMHNRGRLIVSSYLIKTLLIDWRKGAQYFSTKLTDYDPASNQLNWQWTASTGPDSQPYFRIFNPYLQGKEHDPDCLYIKKWVPELATVPNADIHNWATSWETHKEHIKYPKPIVDYVEQKEKAIKMYKEIY